MLGIIPLGTAAPAAPARSAGTVPISVRWGPLSRLSWHGRSRVIAP